MQDDDRSSKTEVPSAGTQTLMRGLDILDEVIEGPVAAVDLARKLGLTKSTLHRLVSALRARHYLTATKTGYSLGPKLLLLGSKAEGQVDVVRLARPHLEQLSARTGFCAFVGRREGDWSRHLDRVTGTQRLRVATSPGDRRPIAETGLGKALLLDDDDESISRLYRQSIEGKVPRERLDAWCERMAVHRALGIVMHDSELDDAVRSVAAPVRDTRGKIAAAISVAGASHYLDDAAMRSVAVEVEYAASTMSRVLGYQTT